MPKSEVAGWQECKSRADMADTLIQDNTDMVRGMTEQGYVQTYGRAEADRVLDCSKEFGDKIKRVLHAATTYN